MSTSPYEASRGERLPPWHYWVQRIGGSLNSVHKDLQQALSHSASEEESLSPQTRALTREVAERIPQARGIIEGFLSDPAATVFISATSQKQVIDLDLYSFNSQTLLVKINHLFLR